MNQYHLSTTNKDKEKKIVKHILQENRHDTSILDTPIKPKTAKQKLDQNEPNSHTLERDQVHYQTIQKLFSKRVLHRTQHHW